MKRIALALTFILALLVSSMVGMHFGTAQSGTISGNSWATKAPMQVARANLGVAVVNGDIYAIGGNTVTGAYNWDQGFSYGINGGTVNTNEQYDPSTNSWTFKAPMRIPRDSFAIAVFQDKIYCIGGRTSIPSYSPQTFTTVNEVYDPATDTWQFKAPLPTAQWPLQASVVDGNIYVIGRSGVTYVYNPINDSWATKAMAPSVNNEPI